LHLLREPSELVLKSRRTSSENPWLTTSGRLRAGQSTLLPKERPSSRGQLPTKPSPSLRLPRPKLPLLGRRLPLSLSSKDSKCRKPVPPLTPTPRPRPKLRSTSSRARSPLRRHSRRLPTRTSLDLRKPRRTPSSLQPLLMRSLPPKL